MSFRFLLRPRWLALTLLIVVAVGVMVRLSIWQWDRLAERRDVNAAIEARADLPTDDVSVVVPPELSLDEVEDLAFRRVSATGVYDEDHQMLVANRTYDGLAGWWVATPLRLDDGRVLVVNRGWVPREVAPEGPWDEFAPVEGTVQVVGLLERSQTGGGGPTDDPSTLPRLDLDVVGERVDGEVVPLWLRLEDQQPPRAGNLPFVLRPPETDDGPHLSYAIQWLVFAGLTLAVYVVLVVRAARRGDDTGRAEVAGGH